MRELLAEKLEYLLRNSSTSQQLAHNARLRAQEEFSLDRMQELYRGLYSNLLPNASATDRAA